MASTMMVTMCIAILALLLNPLRGLCRAFLSPSSNLRPFLRKKLASPYVPFVCKVARGAEGAHRDEVTSQVWSKNRITVV